MPGAPYRSRLPDSTKSSMVSFLCLWCRVYVCVFCFFHFKHSLTQQTNWQKAKEINDSLSQSLQSLKDLLSCFKRSNLQLTLIKTLFPFCFDISKTKHDLMQRVRTTKNEQSHLNLWWLSGLKCFIETDWAQTKDKDKHISQWFDSVLHYLMCEKCCFLYSMQMVQSVGNH